MGAIVKGIQDILSLESIKIFDEKEPYTKDITINDDGTFKDTLKVTEGRFYFKNVGFKRKLKS